MSEIADNLYPFKITTGKKAYAGAIKQSEETFQVNLEDANAPKRCASRLAHRLFGLVSYVDLIRAGYGPKRTAAQSSEAQKFVKAGDKMIEKCLKKLAQTIKQI